MINYYSSEEQEIVRKNRDILDEVLKKVLEAAKPGITTKFLDEMADDLIQKAGAVASFKMEKGYHWATCMNVNDIVVHGIPDDYQLQEDDILGIDIGIYKDGFHADGAWTIKILDSGQNDRFLKTGEKALEEAIKVCKAGNKIGDVSSTIQNIIESAGYSVVKQLVGHGVGKDLHEDPEIPNYQRGNIKNTPLIKSGMNLAVEIIYNEGKSPIVYANDDGWTIVTRDGTLSGLFEKTIIIP